MPPARGPRRSGLSRYLAVLRLPGALAFSATGLVARLPIAMVGLSVVLLVTDRDGSYALAGALAATVALAAAVLGPFGSRFADRFGQRSVLPVLAGGQALGLVALVAGIDGGWPLSVLFGLAVAAGGLGPNIGSLVRARWIGLLKGDDGLRTAFAWESIADEMVFIVGPPLATVLALRLGPAVPLLVCAALVAAGSTALAVQRRTDPPVVAVRAGRTGRHAMLLPGMPELVALAVLLGMVFGAFEVTTVAFAAEQDARGATGLLLAMYAAGSLTGGLCLGALALPGALAGQLRTAAVVLGAVSTPIALAPGVGWLAGLALAAGLAVAPVLIISASLQEVIVPPARITEALTVFGSGLAVGVAIAAPAAGVIIDGSGARGGYLLMSAAALGTAAVGALGHGRLLRLERSFADGGAAP